MYDVSNCEDEAFQKKFMEEFKSVISSLHETWQICGKVCDFRNIRIRCTGSGRVRRDTEGIKRLEISFDSEFDSAQKSAADLVSGHVKEGMSNLTISVDGVKMTVNETETDVKLSCVNGSVAVANKCGK